MLAELQAILKPETRFLAACSYLPASETGFRKQRFLLERACGCAGSTSTKKLWKGIGRHRTFAIADQVIRSHSLADRFGEHHRAMVARAKQSRLESLRLQAESEQLSSALTALEIDHRFIKGPLLSKKLYGDASLRHSKDLDLLVRPQQVDSAFCFLEREGWQPLRHRGLWHRSSSYRWLSLRTLRHYQFVHPEKQVMVELHWLLEQAYAPRLERVWWDHWDAPEGEISDAEVLNLCLHGANHGWARLKWIGDLQSLIERRPHLWSKTLALSHELGLESVVAQTIWLLHALFDTKPDQTATEILKRHPESWSLARFALAQIQQPEASAVLSPGLTVPYWPYWWRLNARLSPVTRLLDMTATFALAEHLEAWDQPAALIPVIPLLRAGSLVRRYCFNR